MAKKNNKKSKKLYLIIIGVIFIILIAINLYHSNDNKIISSRLENEEKQVVDLEEIEKQHDLTKLKNMEERDRIEYYFGMFLDCVENSEYEKAYNMLYSDFRKQYFPTLESFEEYIPTIFSEMTNIEHENIERNGDVYVLWINISDALNGKKNEKKSMNIVIKENDYNDFVLSFSII